MCFGVRGGKVGMGAIREGRGWPLDLFRFPCVGFLPKTISLRPEMRSSGGETMPLRPETWPLRQATMPLPKAMISLRVETVRAGGETRPPRVPLMPVRAVAKAVRRSSIKSALGIPRMPPASLSNPRAFSKGDRPRPCPRQFSAEVPKIPARFFRKLRNASYFPPLTCAEEMGRNAGRSMENFLAVGNRDAASGRNRAKPESRDRSGTFSEAL